MIKTRCKVKSIHRLRTETHELLFHIISQNRSYHLTYNYLGATKFLEFAYQSLQVFLRFGT